MAEPAAERLSTWQSLKAVATHWRPASVALLQFPSGLPLGLVWFAMPAWLREQGVDLKAVSLLTLAQAPWSFKFLWSPLMERYPIAFLGRRRGYILASQAALLPLWLWVAALSDRPDQVALIAVLALVIAFVSATQDIAIDAHAVETLRKDEHGAAVGARHFVYRVAMFLSGRLSITAAGWTSWPVVNTVLALFYVPSMVLTRAAPEPEAVAQDPRSIRQAIWEPFVGMLGQHRAVEILAFVLLYKLSDNLTQALTGPFLVDMGFSAWDRGFAVGTIGLIAIVLGTFLGGLMTQSVGLGRALWIGGLLQIFSNLGYAAVAHRHVPGLLVAGDADRAVMYLATSIEYLTTGMGNGAFGALLLRLTQKRFSATQYALLSSIFSLPRVLAGPPVALLVDAIGWRDFFVFTLVTGIPGLVMLYRFVPWGTKEPTFHVAVPAAGPPLARRALVFRATLVGLATWGVSVLCSLSLDAIRAHRAQTPFDWWAGAARIVRPESVGDGVTLLAVLTIGVLTGLATAAGLAARSAGRTEEPGIPPPAVP